MLEAMSVGLPAAVTNVGDLADVAADGVTGTFVTGTDPADDAARLLKLLAETDRLAVMSRHARQRITQHYDVVSTAER